MIIKEYVKHKKDLMREKVLSYPSVPKLAIIQVNEDAGSNAYVKGKINDSDEIGVEASLIKLPLETSEQELLERIDALNKDKTVDALIVQMPLPKQINEEHIKRAVIPEKDIDGFNPLSCYSPCTPKGIISYLKAEGVEMCGKNAVVIGRSNIVGKPMAKLLLKENCNVTVLHSKTLKIDMDFYLEHADIIVIAIGKKWFLSNQKLKKTAVVIDVGISRDDGKLYGDAQPGLDVAIQTPVPGGVGLITRVTLLENLLEAYENGIQHQKH